VTFGFFVAAIFLGCALYQLVTGQTTVRWPFKPIRIERNPRLFWITTGFQSFIGLCGLAYALFHA